MTATRTLVHFIRHGDALPLDAAPVGGAGYDDLPLSEKGAAQAESLALRLLAGLEKRSQAEVVHAALAEYFLTHRGELAATFTHAQKMIAAGDLSGLARPGEPSDRTTKRAQETGDDWAPTAFPVRFPSLGASGIGVPVLALIYI